MENYKLLERAGEGAHGQVYKGLNLSNNKSVALKKIRVNTDNGIPKNTMREICSLRALRSKHIVKMFDCFGMDGCVIIVMEYLECSLAEILKNITLSLSQIKTYTKWLLLGLRVMHRKSIMHRDLKPANLLINSNGLLKIADFGLSRIYNENFKRPLSHQVATRWYRAPELLYGSKNYTIAVDIWAVGCIIGEMIENHPLFPGESDIEQLAIVLANLGTPTEENWPDLNNLPDYNKISFQKSEPKDWSIILPQANKSTIDLIKRILLYDSEKRLTADEALSHNFFHKAPFPCDPARMPKPDNLDKLS